MDQLIHLVDKLNRVYNISSISYVLFSSEGEDLFHKPEIADFYYPASFLKDNFSKLEKNDFPYIFSIQKNVYIGLFRTKDYALLLGPIATNTTTINIDQIFIAENLSNQAALQNVFGSSTPVSISKFANLLSIVLELCTGIDLSPEKILEDNALQNISPWDNVIKNITDFDNEIIDLCLFEVSLFNSIKSGNILALNELRSLNYPPLIQKNLGVAKADQFVLFPLLTVMSRAAIFGGANAKNVFELYNKAIHEYHKYSFSIEYFDLILSYGKKFCSIVNEKKYPTERTDICNLIERYIQWNKNDNITLSDLANYCNLSKRQIQRIFAKYFHWSFTDYILISKIEKAKTLLYSTNLSISDISISLGFVSQSYFTKRFKDVIGQTPSEFRSSKPLL